MDERKVEDLCFKTVDKNEVSIPQNSDDSGKSCSGPLEDRNGANRKQTEKSLSKIPLSSKDVDLNARGAAIRTEQSGKIVRNSSSINNNETFCGLQNVLVDSTEFTSSIRPLSEERSLIAQAAADSTTMDLIHPEVLQVEKRLNALLDETEEDCIPERTVKLEKLLRRAYSKSALPVTHGENFMPQTTNILNDTVDSLSPLTSHLENSVDAGQPGLSQEYSAVPQRDSISDYCIDDLLPTPPSTSPCGSNLCDSTDAGQTGRPLFHSSGCSSASSKSLSKKYVHSSASVDSTQPIPDPRTDGYGEKQILVPKYKSDGNGYCWPTEILPLGGNLRFDENKQWMTDDQIGQGASGACYRASIIADDQNNSGTLCVKKVIKYNREEVLSLYLSAKDQKEAPSIAGSKNIVTFYGATFWRHKVCIFMEFMKGKTVQDLLNERNVKDCGLPKDSYMQYLADVLSALNFLHGKGIVHNDVKSANVLLDRSRLQAKLADFGDASPIFDNERSQLIKKDVWSAGCFLLDMINCCDRKISSLRFGNNTVDLPHHDDKDTNDIIQLFFGNKNANQQYNANFILREINHRGYKS